MQQIAQCRAAGAQKKGGEVTYAGEANKKGGIYDRLSNTKSFTGVCAENVHNKLIVLIVMCLQPLLPMSARCTPSASTTPLTKDKPNLGTALTAIHKGA